MDDADSSTTSPLFEIGQDGFGVLSVGDRVNLFTSGVQTCFIVGFKLISGAALVHDSGHINLLSLSTIIPNETVVSLEIGYNSSFVTKGSENYQDLIIYLKKLQDLYPGKLVTHLPFQMDSPINGAISFKLDENGVLEPFSASSNLTECRETEKEKSTHFLNYLLCDTIYPDLQFKDRKIQPQKRFSGFTKKFVLDFLKEKIQDRSQTLPEKKNTCNVVRKAVICFKIVTGDKLDKKGELEKLSTTVLENYRPQSYQI